MADRRNQIRASLARLIQDGAELLVRKDVKNSLGATVLRAVPDHMKYHEWYSQALPLIRQLLPDRYDEFQSHYASAQRRKLDPATYTISDFLLGISHPNWGEETPSAAFSNRFAAQLGILTSAATRLDSILSDITAVLQAELFDDEIEAAATLVKAGYLRAAGALAGVALERHLAAVASSHKVVVRKKDPTISELNDPLKEAGTIDLPTWRFIQRLADLRNLCDHAKQREPTRTEIDELIEGVRRIIKTVL